MIKLAIKLLLKAAAWRALKKQGQLIYLKALDAVRRSVRFLFLIILCSQVMICGLGMIVYSAFQLLPLDEVQRHYWMLGIGGLFLIVPLALVLWGTSDRAWLNAAHSEKDF